MVDEIRTIGHSTLPLEEFIHLLLDHGVRTLADLRSYPGSRRCPWFGSESLARALRAEGIAYEHIPDLGGRRNKQKDVDRALNAAWNNPGFQNYADWTLSADYVRGIERLEQLARQGLTAYMCSEAVPWRCHRLLVSTYLLSRGWKVRHIMGNSGLTMHQWGKWGPMPQRMGDNVIYPKED